MYKDQCPTCSKEFHNESERGLKLAMHKHIWWHTNKMKPKTSSKEKSRIEARREYQRHWRAKQKEKLKFLEQGADHNGSNIPEIHSKSSISKQVILELDEIFSTIRHCPGCGRDLYKVYLGIKMAEKAGH